jgi:CheY-like chemotaxis protein
LIIEDNVDAADSLREVLELSGHEVAVAYNGPDGLAKAREWRPEVLLCDIGLPGMDGYEVARAFRADEALRKTFLVALSGYALPVKLVRSWPKPSANPAHPVATSERQWRLLSRAVASSLIATALLRLPVATDTLPSARPCDRRSGSAQGQPAPSAGPGARSPRTASAIR